MLPDRVSNPGPLTYESGALPIALRGPAGFSLVNISKSGFHWSAFANQQGSTFTETNRNGLIYHIGCLITLSDRNGLIVVLVSTDFDHTGCLITLSDLNGPILDLVYPILTIFLTLFQPILADLITESDKAVRACIAANAGYGH